MLFESSLRPFKVKSKKIFIHIPKEVKYHKAGPIFGAAVREGFAVRYDTAAPFLGPPGAIRVAAPFNYLSPPTTLLPTSEFLRLPDVFAVIGDPRRGPSANPILPEASVIAWLRNGAPMVTQRDTASGGSDLHHDQKQVEMDKCKLLSAPASPVGKRS